ncbi:MAG TPA: PadR family transcriptional regulator [Solirubrobacteraceae bacterium]|nr:PadR family transcriptional regulator [Solirubrobacteraceae bacterium]
MSTVRLTETSYIVMGLLEACEPATPYDLKQVAKLSTMHFWHVPHTQLYTESARLAEAGLLSETREHEGRRRRVYRLTDEGRAALARWRADPTSKLGELRDGATLKLFFGADPVRLAHAQLQMHRELLAEYETILAELGESPIGWRRALTLGIAHERQFVAFWQALADGQVDAELAASAAAHPTVDATA